MAVTAVFDTNILFSATGWRGAPYQCIERARAGDVEAVTCPELLEELADKLSERMHFSPEQVADTIADDLGFLRLVQIPKILDVVTRDPEDNMVIESALEGRAQYIVSGDTDLLVLRSFRNIQIIRAAEFLRILA